MSKVKLLQPLRGSDNTDSKKRELVQVTNVALGWLPQTCSAGVSSEAVSYQCALTSPM